MNATAKETHHRHRLTVRDYLRMGEAGIFHEDDRVELIEGEIIDRAPIGSGHAGQVNRISNLLKLAVGDQAIVSVQNPIILGDRSAPQPDIVLLRPRAEYYTTSHPQAQDILLVIEVADSTLDYDRDIKLPLYARHGIPTAWLIDVNGRKLSCYSGAAAEGYREVMEPAMLDALSVPGLARVAVNLEGLF